MLKKTKRKTPPHPKKKKENTPPGAEKKPQQNGYTPFLERPPRNEYEELDEKCLRKGGYLKLSY